MKRRKTAGELSVKAQKDSTKYNAIDVGYALCDDVMQQLEICAQRHNPIFDEDEYCLGFVLAGDPLIKNVMRRKFFAMLYLPSPRPNQSVFLFNKRKNRIVKRLWVLPNAATMAELSTLPIVHDNYKSMKAWSDAFFEGKFWHFIREQHGIKMLSEHEYLNANREKLIQSGCQELDAPLAQPFDFSKVTIEKIIDTKDTVINENSLDGRGKAQSLNGNVGA